MDSPNTVYKLDMDVIKRTIVAAASMFSNLDERVQILGWGLLIALMIVAYGTFRCKTSDFKDPLTRSMFGHPWNKFLDGWGITHLLFYMALARYYPSQWLFIWLMGAAWEVIEVIFKDHPFYISKCNYNLQTADGEGWWYGRWQDIVMNSIGIYIGHRMATRA